MNKSRSDLRQDVFHALTEGNAPGGSLDDFDVEAIVDELAQLEEIDDPEISHDRFWEIVQRHDRTQG